MTSRGSANGSGDRPQQPLLHGVDWAAGAGVGDEVIAGARTRAKRNHRRRLAGTAAAAVAALAIGAWIAAGNRAHESIPASMTAKVDAPERQVLADGSVVELKDGARISVVFTQGFRRVSLLRGEAHFQVAKNKNRPFIVSIAEVEVRAVGTAFSVQRGADKVLVLVTEGTVSLGERPAAVPGGGSDANSANGGVRTVATLGAGNRALIGMATPAGAAPSLEVRPVSADELSQWQAWRVPRLEFTQTPLGEVIRMFNQNSGGRLSLGDESLGTVRISGVLRADHVETLLRLLAEEHGIVAKRLPGGGIELARGH